MQPTWILAALVGAAPSPGPLEPALALTVSEVGGEFIDLQVVMPDLRAVLERQRARLERIGKLKVVARELAPRSKDELDLLATYRELIDAAHPGEGPVRLALSIGETHAHGPIAVLSLGAEPGASERLTKLPLFEHFRAETKDGRTVLSREDGEWRLVLEPVDGAVRIWATDGFDGEVKSGIDLPLALRSQFAGANMLAAFLPNGKWGDQMRAEATEPFEQMLSHIDGVLVGTGWADEASDWTRIMVVHPQLRMVAPMLAARAPATPNPFELWGPEASMLLDLSVPDGLLSALTQAPELSPALQKALEGLDGSVRLALFGGLGDWALALGYGTPPAAEAALPILKTESHQLFALISELLAETVRDVDATRFAVQADPQLPGYDVRAAAGHVVLGSQAARRFGAKQTDPRRAVMREFMSKPSLLKAYMVFGGDFDLSDLYSYGLRLLSPSELEDLPTELRSSYAEFVRALPHMFAVSHAQMLMWFDMALSVELANGAVVIDLMATEI